MISELSDLSVTKWQSEWNHKTKSAITKSFFPKIADRLKMKINVTPNFTTMVTEHGNIKSQLQKYKILVGMYCLPVCVCVYCMYTYVCMYVCMYVLYVCMYCVYVCTICMYVLSVCITCVCMYYVCMYVLCT